MANAALGMALRQIHRLFDEGTVGALTDEQLVARFAALRDESAFQVLVARHGRLVLSVCRSVLRDDHEAEDAFQATFLVLARKAGSVWVRGSLGGWLHRVAYRIAVRASADRRRRRKLEASASVRLADEGRSAWDDWLPVLHEEIDRLPQAQRAPIVLCDLQEYSYEQAALELHCTVPALRGRLAKGRARLRVRLTRRGMASAGGTLGALWAAGVASAAVPESWAERALAAATTRQAALAASALATAAVRAMDLARFLKLAGCAVAGLAALAAVLVAAGLRDEPEPPRPKPEPAAPSPAARLAPKSDRPGATVPLRGRVLDPAGKPVSGATLQLDYHLFRTDLALDQIPSASSRADGTFVLDAPREAVASFGEGRRIRPVRIVASAPGFGPGWAEPGRSADALHDVTIRLVADDVPIEGRVLDHEGQPVAGAIIRTTQFFDTRGSDLGPWIASFKTRTSSPYDLEQMPLLHVKRTTGPDGRFRIDGIGRERVIMFTIGGPTIELTRTFAMTKRVPDFRAGNPHIIAPETLVYHGARFDYVAEPSRPVGGVVRDADTNLPVEGVRINGTAFREGGLSYYHEIESVTDDAGRYLLLGLPQADRYRLFAFPGKGLPYPTATFAKAAGVPAPAAAVIDLSLKRGVLIRGRVTDKRTGKPLKASVETYAFADNPHLKDYPFPGSYQPRTFADADGRFEIAALPGRGLIAAHAGSENYLRGVGTETIPGANPRVSLNTRPSSFFPYNFHVLAQINPEPGTEVVTCDLQCDPGRTRSVTIVDPEGKPLAGARVKGRRPVQSSRQLAVEPARFEVYSLDPRQPRRLYAFHEERGLAGSIIAAADEDGPLVLRLEPQAILTGRVVDEKGEPIGRLTLIDFLQPKFDPARGELNGEPEVGPDGRFRIVVVPGLTYEATAVSEKNRMLGRVFHGAKLAPGETRDLGDVRPTKAAR